MERLYRRRRGESEQKGYLHRHVPRDDKPCSQSVHCTRSLPPPSLPLFCDVPLKEVSGCSECLNRLGIVNLNLSLISRSRRGGELAAFTPLLSLSFCPSHRSSLPHQEAVWPASIPQTTNSSLGQNSYFIICLTDDTVCALIGTNDSVTVNQGITFLIKRAVDE